MDIYGMCMLKKQFKYSGIATAFCLLYPSIASAHTEHSTETLTVIGHQAQIATPDFHTTIESTTPEAQTSATAGALLKNVTGVTVSGTGIANGSNILMRGYDQKGVKIIVDGIHQPLENTMNNLGGLFIESSLIKRVDVKHGSSSIRYGEGAMGGVVSFNTLDPQSILVGDNKLGAKLFSAVSTADRHFTYGGVIAGKHDIAEGLLAYSQRQRGAIRLADGNDMDNNEHIKNYFIKAYLYPTENQTFIFAGRHYDNEGEQRQVLHRMGGYGRYESNQMARSTQQKNYSITHHLAPESHRWLDLTTYLYYSQFKINQTYLTDNSSSGKVGLEEKRTQSTYGLKSENHFTFHLFNDLLSQSGFFGVEGYEQKMISDDNAKNFPLATMRYGATWVQSTISTPLLPLSLSGGARYHYYKNNPNDELDEFFNKKTTIQALKHATDYQGITENIALTFTPTNWLQLYSSYSTALRAPTLSEMFNDSFHFKAFMWKAHWVPNPHLKPERNSTWEYGTRLSFNNLLTSNDNLVLKAAYFDTTSKDYITYGPWHTKTIAGLINLQAFNIPKALIEGIDMSLRYTHPWLSVGLNYNRTKTLELTTFETISPVRPETLTAFVHIPVATTPFSLGWSAQFASKTANKGTHVGKAKHVKGKQTNRLQELIQQYPGYGIHDFSISYQSQKNKDIQAALVLSNAFNYEYYSAMGVPQEGRNIKMSMSYRW
ncbi:TonB-dependent receptor domain-containing protein [Proteus myxofaciens]|uniref:TonB-dependent hemin/ferrichrome receptor n=1 Tax=Proteus myxofaciens ATCC 19692 TaxID=1354337 RepID=A0A198F9D5_9GAMM|nr:TonB-dependent receptor [Proteus myxofaciens]OAT21487.1 TonB-dependent hemin/ferrichrome receptor [Proteus myxofaciens ATCC 19692]